MLRNDSYQGTNTHERAKLMWQYVEMNERDDDFLCSVKKIDEKQSTVIVSKLGIVNVFKIQTKNVHNQKLLQDKIEKAKQEINELINRKK